MNYKNELISHRRLKAKETLEDAKILLDSGRISSAVNRIYYAVFYEVSALLLSKELSSPKHSGVRALFNLHFVKTRIVKPESGRYYAKMFDFRQKSDYGDYSSFDKNKVIEWYKQAEIFIEELEKLLQL